MYEDKTLTCKECGREFVFTAGEQEFYAEKGFVNEPQRCKNCRDARTNAARPEVRAALSGTPLSLYAPPVGKRRGFLSSPGKTALSIVASVLPA